MGRRGKKKVRLDEPPSGPHWLEACRERVDRAGVYLSLDASRRFLGSAEGAEIEAAHRASVSGASASSSHGYVPPPSIIHSARDARTILQQKAWEEEFVWPEDDGMRPIRQPQTPTEELHALVGGLNHALSFSPTRRAVMVCGRPVVVLFTKTNMTLAF